MNKWYRINTSILRGKIYNLLSTKNKKKKMTEQIAVQLRSAYLTCFYLYLFSSASRWKNCCSNEAYNIFYWFWEAVKPPCISASSPHSRSKNDNRKRMFFLSFILFREIDPSNLGRDSERYFDLFTENGFSRHFLRLL